MARRVGDISRTALAEAAGGDHLPTWRTVEKFVLACGGDPNDWRQAWEELRDLTARSEHEESAADDHVPQVTDTPPAEKNPGRQRRRLLLAVVVVMCALTGAGIGIKVLDRKEQGTNAAANPKAEPVPTSPTVIVQNMIAIGDDLLIEDSTPAYLSMRPEPRCRLNNCMIPDSILTTGTAVATTCYVHGRLMSNYNLDSTEVQRNPHRIRSTIWYRLVLPDGRAGYLAEVYLAPQSRGGLGLPQCANDVLITGTG
jgi:hypothetical protein